MAPSDRDGRDQQATNGPGWIAAPFGVRQEHCYGRLASWRTRTGFAAAVQLAVHANIHHEVVARHGSIRTAVSDAPSTPDDHHHSASTGLSIRRMCSRDTVPDLGGVVDEGARARLERLKHASASTRSAQRRLTDRVRMRSLGEDPNAKPIASSVWIFGRMNIQRPRCSITLCTAAAFNLDDTIIAGAVKLTSRMGVWSPAPGSDSHPHRARSGVRQRHRGSAEGEGFEPSVGGLPLQRFSRPPRSTTPAPLRGAPWASGRG
jgi:hypothetical protein